MNDLITVKSVLHKNVCNFDINGYPSKIEQMSPLELTRTFLNLQKKKTKANENLALAFSIQWSQRTHTQKELKHGSGLFEEEQEN